MLETFTSLRGPTFDPEKVASEIRDFYEHTACYEMDVWSQWTGILKPFANLLGQRFLALRYRIRRTIAVTGAR